MNMMQANFLIHGEPTAKGRPRFAKRGNFVITYTDDKTVNYENLVKLEYKNQCGDKYFDADAPLMVQIICFFSRPKNIAKKNLPLYDNNTIRPLKKPDTDNIAKIILDSLNKVAFDDDKQVVRLYVSKLFAKGKPYVEVNITKI